jgi:hypothetical protein
MDDSLAQIELDKAYASRQNGNEGMARVLARRAAGMSIREYLGQKGFDQKGLSLNALLINAEARKFLPALIYEPLDRLSTRVNMDFQLPLNFDLLLDAQIVINHLSMLLENKNDQLRTKN